MFRKITVIKILVLFVFGLFSIKFAYADDTAGLTVSPPVLEKSINKGENVTGVIKLTNDSDNDLKISISKKDFTARDEEGKAQLIEAKNDAAFSLANWVDIIDGFILKPKQVKEVSYTINVPADAEPGGHYGAVLFTPALLNPKTLEGSGTIVSSEIGVLMLVTVPGKINYGAKISEFSTAKRLYLNSKNLVEFITRFQNLSSVHVKAKGTIVVKNMLGKNVAALVVNENEGNALPNSIRKFTNDWEKKYGFGFYKASVNLTYGENNNISDTLMFWIIPWKETLGAIIVIILVAWILSRIQWKKN